MRLPNALHGQDVRLQEAGEEEDQEATRRDHGHHREADPPEGERLPKRVLRNADQLFIPPHNYATLKQECLYSISLKYGILKV